MSKAKIVLLAIAGSILGLLVGGGSVVGLALGLYYQEMAKDMPNEWAGLIIFLLGSLAFQLVAPMGAAAGATITQKLLKRRSSFWRALLGAVAGLVVGWIFVLFLSRCLPGLDLETEVIAAIGLILCCSTVAGAVIGSGWKSKPADTTKVES
jgi:hypothetical protein